MAMTRGKRASLGMRIGKGIEGVVWRGGGGEREERQV